MEKEKECRLCHEVNGPLFAPCLCSGTMRYVHRNCLDMWRAASQNPNSFYFCDVCHFQYQIEDQHREEMSKLAFSLYVIRDISLILIILNLAIVIVGRVILSYDYAILIQEIISIINISNPKWTDTTKDIVVTYELGGLGVFFMIGIMGMIWSLYKICSRNDHQNPRLNPMENYHSYYFYGDLFSPRVCSSVPSHDSHRCCNGDGNGDQAKLLILVIFIVAIVGLFFAVIFGIFFLTKMAKNRIIFLHRKEEAIWMKIKDQSEHVHIEIFNP